MINQPVKSIVSEQKPFQQFSLLLEEMNRVIIGQEVFTRQILIALLSGGHILVQGLPGLAKTTAVKALASCIKANLGRVQFTPDLLPCDITGTEIFLPNESRFSLEKGPVFNDLIVADEINRAPAKVQSALLEAMAEKQVTIGQKTYQLSDIFMVLATQNPIESQGTYPLPQAQLDRFLMMVHLDYPHQDAELAILKQHRSKSMGLTPTPQQPMLSIEDIRQAQKALGQLHMSEAVEQYMIQLVLATRKPEHYDASLTQWIAIGASPRATLALDVTSRAHAWLMGRDFVTPQDIQAVSHDVLGHRIVLTMKATASGKISRDVIDTIIDLIPVP